MLNGKSVYIRLFEREDCKYRTNWVNDEETHKTLMFDWPLSLSGTQKWFESQLLDSTKANFVIIDKESGKTIGMTGLIDISLRHLRAQFYLTIGDVDFRGKHIPNETIPLILEYAFEELGLNRVYLYTLENNDRARKVYSRNGFTFEGILRQHYFCVGKYQDLHVMSILHSDWNVGRKSIKV